jgi:hypothetical protein
MDPAGIFTSKEAATQWFNSVAQEMFNGEYAAEISSQDEWSSVQRSIGGLRGVLLESPNFWRPGTLPTFNKIILGSNPDGTGGSAIQNEDLSGRSIRPPSLTVSDRGGPQTMNFPEWFIVG